jgi:L-seryl-tRNA(Ser) seleniumtransferase
MQMVHYGVYGNVHRFAGAKLVFAGSVSGCTVGELDRLITDNTAAISYTFSYGGVPASLSLEQVAEIAHARGVPVMVDAAAMVPPRNNLRRFILEGADLVTFSGGKFIGGPQSTGLLFGRADLVEAAMMNSGPGQSIGRPQKVGREDLIGMATALQLYSESDEDAAIARMSRQAERIQERLSRFDDVETTVELDQQKYFVPNCIIIFKNEAADASDQVASGMHEGNPRVYVARAGSGLAVNTFNLQEGEEEIVADRLVEEIGKLSN